MRNSLMSGEKLITVLGKLGEKNRSLMCKWWTVKMDVIYVTICFRRELSTEQQWIKGETKLMEWGRRFWVRQRWEK